MEMNKGFWRRSQKCIELKILSGNYFRDHRFNPSLHRWWHRRRGKFASPTWVPGAEPEAEWKAAFPRADSQLSAPCATPELASKRHRALPTGPGQLQSLLAPVASWLPRLPQSSITKSIRWNNDCEVLCQSPSNFQLQRVNCISVIGKTSILN